MVREWKQNDNHWANNGQTKNCYFAACIAAYHSLIVLLLSYYTRAGVDDATLLIVILGCHIACAIREQPCSYLLTLSRVVLLWALVGHSSKTGVWPNDLASKRHSRAATLSTSTLQGYTCTIIIFMSCDLAGRRNDNHRVCYAVDEIDFCSLQLYDWLHSYRARHWLYYVRPFIE